VASLSGSSGREGPARTALSLILHSSYSSLLSPVPRVRSVNVFGGLISSVNVARRHLESVEDSSEFLVGQVSKFVHGQSVSRVLGIVFVNEFLVVLEDGKSVLEFSMIVRFAVLLHPLNKEVLVLSFSSEGESTSEKDGEDEKGLHG
jgi:hypothetical protein